MKGRLVLTMVFLALLFVFPTYSKASTITVNTTTDELNIDGDCSLREAIAAANNNIAIDACSAGQQGKLGFVDLISIPGGTFTIALAEGLNVDDNTGGDLDVFDSADLVGTGSTGTIVSGNDLYRVFDVHIPDYNNSQISFQNLQITQGYTSKYDASTNGGITAVNINDGGGGVRCGRGGTHYNPAAPLTSDFFQTCNFSNVNIIDNTSAGLGGGVLCGGRSDEDYPLNYNGKSGGVTCNFDSVSFVGNHNNNAASILDLSLQDGAGLACSGDSEFTPTAACNLVNTTFSGNGSFTLPTNLTLKGGAIACVDASLDVQFSTLFANEAITAGGVGVINTVANSGNPIIDYSTCPITFQGTIIENDSQSTPPTSYDNCEPGTNTTSNNHNLESTNHCGLLGANDLTNTTSGLGTTATTHYPSSLYTHLPQAGAAVIDAAGSYCPLCSPARDLILDARGVTRPLDGDGNNNDIYDMGAVEVSRTDASIGGTVSPSTAILGTDSILYNITITNNGSQDAYGIQVTSTLPAVLNTVPPPTIVPPSGGFCIYAAPTVTCEISHIAPSAAVNMSVLAVPGSTGAVSTTFTLSPISYLESDNSNDSVTLNSNVATVTDTPTATATATATPSITPTSTPGPSSTPTSSPTITPTPTNTTTPASTNTPGPSATPSRTPTQTPQANIGIESFTDSPDPVSTKSPVTFAFVVKNYGNSTANNVVTVLDLTQIMAYGQKLGTLPNNCVTVGSKRGSSKVVECAWGSLSALSTLAWSIAVESWPVAGTFNTGLQIYQNESDPNTSNNSSLISTTVRCVNNQTISSGTCTTPTPQPSIFFPSITPPPPSATSTPSRTPTPTVIPTLTTSSGWWIVENATLHLNDTQANNFPPNKINCPESNDFYFLCGNPGLLSTQDGTLDKVFKSTIPPAISSKDWTLDNYSLSDVFRVSSAKSFFDYLSDKHAGQKENYPNLENFLLKTNPSPKKLHFVESNNNTIDSVINFDKRLALVVKGDLHIDGNPNPNPNKFLLLIVDGTVSISERISGTRSNAINAIIIAQKINIGGKKSSVLPNPIVINGGYYSYEPSANVGFRLSRASDENKYPIDIIYDPASTLGFLDILSISPTIDL